MRYAVGERVLFRAEVYHKEHGSLGFIDRVVTITADYGSRGYLVDLPGVGPIHAAGSDLDRLSLLEEIAYATVEAPDALDAARGSDFDAPFRDLSA